MDDHKVLVRRFLTAVGKGDASALRELLCADAVAICTGTSLVSGQRDREQICAAAGMLRTISKDGIDFDVLSMTTEDDRVSCEAHGRSTLVSGAPYHNQYHFLFYFRDGRISQLKEYIDTKLADQVLAPLFQTSSPS